MGIFDLLKKEKERPNIDLFDESENEAPQNTEASNVAEAYNNSEPKESSPQKVKEFFSGFTSEAEGETTRLNPKGTYKKAMHARQVTDTLMEASEQMSKHASMSSYIKNTDNLKEILMDGLGSEYHERINDVLEKVNKVVNNESSINKFKELTKSFTDAVKSGSFTRALQCCEDFVKDEAKNSAQFLSPDIADARIRPGHLRGFF